MTGTLKMLYTTNTAGLNKNKQERTELQSKLKKITIQMNLL